MLRRKGRFSDEEISSILKGILRGLSHIHSLGFAHLNVKPSNVLLDRSGRPLLSDLGLCIPPRHLNDRQRDAFPAVDPVNTPLAVGVAADLLAVAKLAYSMMQGSDAAGSGPMASASASAAEWATHPLLASAYSVKRLLKGTREVGQDFVVSAMVRIFKSPVF